MPDKILEIKIPGSVELDPKTTVEFRAFLQAMTNRRVVGAMRYGDRPKSRQKYMTRLWKEFRAYRKTGNIEHLLNVGVYAFLESVAPEHKAQRWDAAAESATRAEMGGEIA